MLLDELVARLTQLPEKSRTEAIDLAVKSTATMAWVPNPGPQTQAFLCEADELFYGGEAGVEKRICSFPIEGHIVNTGFRIEKLENVRGSRKAKGVPQIKAYLSGVGRFVTEGHHDRRNGSRIDRRHLGRYARARQRSPRASMPSS